MSIDLSELCSVCGERLAQWEIERGFEECEDHRDDDEGGSLFDSWVLPDYDENG